MLNIEFETEKVLKIIEEDHFLSHKYYELLETNIPEREILIQIFNIYILGNTTFEFKYSQIK